MKINVETTKMLVDYLKERGHNVTYDENPSPEKIARIKTIIGLKKRKEKELIDAWK